MLCFHTWYSAHFLPPVQPTAGSDVPSTKLVCFFAGMLLGSSPGRAHFSQRQVPNSWPRSYCDVSSMLQWNLVISMASVWLKLNATVKATVQLLCTHPLRTKPHTKLFWRPPAFYQPLWRGPSLALSRQKACQTKTTDRFSRSTIFNFTSSTCVMAFCNFCAKTQSTPNEHCKNTQKCKRKNTETSNNTADFVVNFTFWLKFSALHGCIVLATLRSFCA